MSPAAARRLLWLLAAVLWLPLHLGGVWLETAAVAMAAGCALLAAAGRRRNLLLPLGAVLLASALASLALHLALDHFHYHYVWLYSARVLPVHLKVANLWGGEEGTLLLLATLMILAAVALQRDGGRAAAGAAALTALFAVATLIWSPFRPVDPALVTGGDGRGMNVHLMSIWMAIHPPLIFVAYVLILAPVGSALDSLARGRDGLGRIGERFTRSGWLILTLGLGTGMWWAFQDFTFGQVWHWDPVQTSVFVVWALTTAGLHGLRRYQADGALSRVVPLLGLAAGAAVLVSMAITRSPDLASSHRYVGDTSVWLFVCAAVVLVVAAAAAFARSRRRRAAGPVSSPLGWPIAAAVALFAAVAALASAALGQAFAGAWLEWPRPEFAKPFFELVARWSSADELPGLTRAFAQWDVDGLSLNRWLAPIGAALALTAGHAFLRLRPLPGWSVTAAVAVLAIVTGLYLHPVDSLYRGTGMTSQQTVALFFWLDVLAVCSLYLLGAAAVWLVRVLRRPGGDRVYQASVALVHMGAVIAVLAMVAGSTLDSYAQQILRLPEDLGRPVAMADGIEIEVGIDSVGAARDGGRHGNGVPFYAASTVRMSMTSASGPRRVFDGHTLYRDERPPLLGETSSVRQLCQILDYRYARYAGTPGYLVDPFIRHDALTARQVWVAPIFHPAATGERPPDRAAMATVVVRSFPLLTWLWIGITLACAGATVITVQAWRRHANTSLGKHSCSHHDQAPTGSRS